MKKILSVFLAVLMLMTAFTTCLAVFAEDGDSDGHALVITCTCVDCNKTAGSCHCCAACPYLDKTYLLACAKDENGNFKGSYCCGECNGIWPCDCTCECCANKSDNLDTTNVTIIDDNTRDTIINTFQNVLKKISDVFDMLFDAIFRFLRIGEYA